MSSETDKIWQKRLSDTKTKLDAVSPTFCAAKWRQLTLHLQHGHTHSCHHPPSHKVPLVELEISADALHNTKFKNEQRELMREGKRPAECAFCWKAEDASPETYSDRVIKSADAWAGEDFTVLAASNQPLPTYLEVSFGNTCNMRCMYCAPDISSSIWAEFEKHGPYPVRNSLPIEWYIQEGKKPFRADETNPYLDAFHTWFPKVLNSLKVFRITGGEPLLNPNTFKALQWLEDRPHIGLDFAINTNLMVSSEVIQRVARSMESMVDEGKVHKARLYTSVDTHGAAAEYIRHGLDYAKLMREAHAFLKSAPQVGLTFIVTHNIFSFQDFDKLLSDILAMKKAHIRHIEPVPRVMMDLTVLSSPQYLSSLLAPAELRRNFSHAVRFMDENAESSALPWGFNAYERNKARRLLEMLMHESESDAELLSELGRFVGTYDGRKGTNFTKSMPALEEFLRPYL